MTPCSAAHQASLFLSISRNLPKFMSIELVIFSNHLILCHPLLLLPSVFPSIWLFSNQLALHNRQRTNQRFSISLSNEYSGLISLRIDWFDLLAVQETLNSLLQHHSLKASILSHSALLIVQLSHPCMTKETTTCCITRATLTSCYKFCVSLLKFALPTGVYLGQ